MSYRGKPIIGIVGGIGSGKSRVARVLGELGCAVIDSDALAHAVYAEPDVVETIVGWYGDSIVDERVQISRKALAHHVFRDQAQRRRLEALIHPRIHAQRDKVMADRADDPKVRGFVWDSPLLIEAGLHLQCDAVIYVDVPYAQRLRRVSATRGWDAAELDRREASQRALEEKRRLSSVIVPGDACDAELGHRLEQILASVAAR